MDRDTTVVTGASRGIGAAVVREFADAGAHVVACARDVDELDELAATVESADGTVTTQRADVRDEFDVERLMETAAREGGGIDTVVANAGVYHGQPGETPLTSESYAAFDDHLRTNGRGTFTTVRESLPHLAPDARILVTSGSVAREPKPGYGSYAVSKATAEAVARGFAADLDHPVAVVDPGVVSTELTGGTGRDPADVAGMFRWAATAAPAEDLDGGVLDLKAWKRATR
ncbi:SDR family NAD(P)-dependent oxidoreductase [Halorientalis pallida]|uniref:SDR family oxidoreductase n=1 Tax=Halorientalis pallida TaxID=2479928 RepID=A0A498L363_9EURY|nr:SDR family oxidoreductase [Halorientalis pallida]RXK51751.1 SDR family oxidoreductase [Halorientalis pallida]